MDKVIDFDIGICIQLKAQIEPKSKLEHIPEVDANKEIVFLGEGKLLDHSFNELKSLICFMV